MEAHKAVEKVESLQRTFQVRGTDGALREVDIYTEEGFHILSDLWTRSGWQRKISYEVSWLGIPIIQLPEDILIMQELIYKVRPHFVVETGTAHGGSAIFYASMLELLGQGQVISIDREIRKYNLLAIKAHPMSRRITLIEADAVADSTAQQVRSQIPLGSRVLVTLDSNHTRAHVLAELEQYASLVSEDSYVVVFDGIMPAVSDAPNGNPAWSSDNPLSALTEFLQRHPEFEMDPYYNRLRVTYCPHGFLRRKETP